MDLGEGTQANKYREEHLRYCEKADRELPKVKCELCGQLKRSDFVENFVMGRNVCEECLESRRKVPRPRLSKLQRLILQELGKCESKRGRPLSAWPWHHADSASSLRMKVAERYAALGKDVFVGVDQVISKATNATSDPAQLARMWARRKKVKLLTNKFSVSFHRSLRNLEVKGLIRLWMRPAHGSHGGVIERVYLRDSKTFGKHVSAKLPGAHSPW